MFHVLHRFIAAVAIVCTSPGAAVAAGPSGGSYEITQSVIASGVPSMAAGTYSVSASVGQLARLPMGGGTATAYPGFWASFAGVVAAVQSCLLDLDGNGTIDPLTDGVMLVRVMLGVVGPAVTNNAIGVNATRKTWAEIQPLINLAPLDVDLNGHTDALDGLLLMRAMFGLTGTAVTTGMVDGSSQRADWNAIRSYLNINCGTTFAP